jgi:hypothetical protein
MHMYVTAEQFNNIHLHLRTTVKQRLYGPPLFVDFHGVLEQRINLHENENSDMPPSSPRYVEYIKVGVIGPHRQGTACRRA